jgi:hypothetical protein
MFENYLNPVEKMSKYILIVDNSSLTPHFSDMVLNCIRDHIGVYNMAGNGKYFTICFTHSYDLQRLTDTLNGLFSNHKTNAFNLFLINTYGWSGFDTQDNLKFYKKFDKI